MFRFAEHHVRVKASSSPSYPRQLLPVPAARKPRHVHIHPPRSVISPSGCESGAGPAIRRHACERWNIPRATLPRAVTAPPHVALTPLTVSLRLSNDIGHGK